MKAFFVSVVVASVLFGFASSASAQAQFAGTYYGVFSVLSCKSGYYSDDGVFQITAQPDGPFTGMTSNSYGDTEIAGFISSKGKIIGYSAQTGSYKVMKGKMDKTGLYCSGKVKTVCKFAFYGQKQ